MKFGVGQSVARVEDKRFVTGTGCYTDDVTPGAGLRVAFLRAPYAHARLQNLDYGAAVSAPGVRLVASQADLDADHFPPLDIHMRNTPCQNNILGIKGSGEAGAIGAPQGVVGAVCDALDIRHVDMPVTPQKIFDILHNRQAGTEAE